tara:strand:+ start:358 stop:498 length:141 start_codon:yes stop_codon:yes gene_type:complete
MLKDYLFKNLNDYRAYLDEHFFELKEQPFGPYNKKQIEFCLGCDWI